MMKGLMVCHLNLDSNVDSRMKPMSTMVKKQAKREPNELRAPTGTTAMNGVSTGVKLG